MSMISVSLWWAGFVGVVLLMLVVDLGIMGRGASRGAREIKRLEAGIYSLVWIAVALLFGAVLSRYYGGVRALEFVTAYLVEKSLSVDNLFVFLVLFNVFRLPPGLRYRAMFFGVLGAIALRSIVILLGLAVVQHFKPLLYVFGLLLLFTAYKILRDTEDDSPEKHPVLRLLRRLIPTTSDYHGTQLLVREGGRRLATPLLLLMACVAATDLIFAVDSIPAVIAISSDRFIVLSSNVFAVLGLRALFFLIGDLLGTLHYLKVGLALILGFVGTKMLLSGIIHVPIHISLLVIALIMGGAVAASLLRRS